MPLAETPAASARARQPLPGPLPLAFERRAEPRAEECRHVAFRMP
jgi:hypothetical protein